MTLQPILPWWLMATLIAGAGLFLAWRLVLASREPYWRHGHPVPASPVAAAGAWQPAP